MFQKRLHANITAGAGGEQEDTSVNFKPLKRRNNLLTDRMKKMMVDLLMRRRRRRHRRELRPLDLEATRQTIDTCLSYAELWSRTWERDALLHFGDRLCEVECRATDVGKVAQLVSRIFSKRLLMSVRWESGIDGLSHRQSCRCQNSLILQTLYSHTPELVYLSKITNTVDMSRNQQGI